MRQQIQRMLKGEELGGVMRAMQFNHICTLLGILQEDETDVRKHSSRFPNISEQYSNHKFEKPAMSIGMVSNRFHLLRLILVYFGVRFSWRTHLSPRFSQIKLVTPQELILAIQRPWIATTLGLDGITALCLRICNVENSPLTSLYWK